MAKIGKIVADYLSFEILKLQKVTDTDGVVTQDRIKIV